MNDADKFLAALEPIVSALGASVLRHGLQRQGDTPIEWQGEVVGHLRSSELHGALDRMVDGVERELRSPLAEMSRENKQIAVRNLDEQGAFLLRGAVEDVAARMSVSRVTLYAYLNAIRPADT